MALLWWIVRSLEILKLNFKETYIIVTKQLKIMGNNFFEIVEKIVKSTKLDAEKVMAVIAISIELGFYKIIEKDGGVELVANIGSPKRNLEESNIYRSLN